MLGLSNFAEAVRNLVTDATILRLKHRPLKKQHT